MLFVRQNSSLTHAGRATDVGRNSMREMPCRRWFAAALLAIVATTAGVPHTHSLLEFAGDASRRGDEAQIIHCDAAGTSPAHFDAARLVHHAECAACLRQHQQGVGSTSLAQFVRTVYAAPFRAFIAASCSTSASVIQLRGPPTSLLTS
jgi:hypothetical protein